MKPSRDLDLGKCRGDDHLVGTLELTQGWLPCYLSFALPLELLDSLSMGWVEGEVIESVQELLGEVPELCMRSPTKQIR